MKKSSAGLPPDPWEKARRRADKTAMDRFHREMQSAQSTVFKTIGCLGVIVAVIVILIVRWLVTRN